MRRRYLVTYDISDDKRRAAVFDELRGAGDHVQFSVFLCELSAAEAARLRGSLSSAVHHGEDQVLLVDLGPCEGGAGNGMSDGIDAVGRPYVAPSRARVI